MNVLFRIALAVGLAPLLFAAPADTRAPGFDPALYADLTWRMIGPFRAGRTVAVSGVPGRRNLFYMAANGGGVWKSTDAGRVWTPIFDDQPTGSIGALAVSPSHPDVLYVGSGEGLQRPDLSVGNGIYKSVDGGKSWTHLGLSDGRQIGTIRIDPKDPDRLFVAVLGHPYGANAERGVFRSVNGGRTWEKVLFRDADTGAIDLALDPSNPATVYAVLWSARQGPWEYGNGYQGKGSGLFRSDDAGTTWRPLTRGLPTAEQGLGRIGIAVAPTDRRRLYAVVDAKERGGLYRSGDAGESWELVNPDTRLWGRGTDFAEVQVSPKNPDVVFVANIASYRSNDAGKTFTAIKGAPGGDDYHRIWIDPDDPDVMIFGVDQGATVTVNGGATWSSWYNQPTAQLFHVSTDDRFPYRVYGGQQESGSAMVWSRGNDGAITFREFHPVGVEEYGYVAPDPLHPGVIYGGKVSRYDEATGQTQEVGPIALREGKHRFDRTAPVLFSPADPRVLYFASEVLWKTADGGRQWEQISPDLSREKPAVPATLGRFADDDPEAGSRRGVIYAIAPSARDANLIWAGTDDGLVHVTSDGGKTWRDVTPPELTAWSKVTQIDASRSDSASAYVSVSRFRLDDLSPYVYRTHDGGKTWKKIVTGLPGDAPVNVVRADPERAGLLYCGTENQVWVSFDDGDHWQTLRQNMPAVSIRDLVVHGDDLVVGTHGRSFWILDDVTPLRQLDAAVARASAHLFRPQLARRVRWNTNTDTPLPPEEPAAKNPPDGAVIDYWLSAGAATGPVSLEVRDGEGRLVRRFASTDTPAAVDPKELQIATYWIRPARPLSAAAGMHRFVWDLHWPPLEALEHQYPISAIPGDTPREPRGAWAQPGRYTITLTAGGKTFQQPIEVAMDPRVRASLPDLERQFALAMRIADGMREDSRAIERVRRLRGRLRAAKERAGAAASPALDALRDLDAKASRLESAPATTRAQSPDPVAPDSLERLNAQLATLFDVVEGADAAPTAAAIAAVDDALRRLGPLVARSREFESRDLPELDRRLHEEGLPPVPPPPAEPARTDGTDGNVHHLSRAGPD